MYNADWSENVLLAVNSKCKCIYACKYTHLQPSALLSVIHGLWSNLLHQLHLWARVTESLHSTVLIHLPSNVTLSHAHTLDELGFTVAFPPLKASARFAISLHATAIFLAQLSWTPVSCEGWNGEQGLRWPMRGVLCEIQARIKLLTPRCIW